jgi:SAM-dependent methyltransferase
MKDYATSYNRNYYETAYNLQGGLATYFRKRLSFDQGYKSSINWNLLSGWISAGHKIDSVLEIGFGFGLTLAKFPKTVILFGTDISWNAVRLFHQLCINERRKNLFCVNDTLGALPLCSQFDVIICSHVLEHVIDDVALLHEFRRLLAPTGVLLLNVPINELDPDPKHVRRYDAEMLKQKLFTAKFRVVQQLTADRWSSFFKPRPSKMDVVAKAMRAVCALLPYDLCEYFGNLILRDLPFRQLAVLAVPLETSSAD